MAIVAQLGEWNAADRRSDERRLLRLSAPSAHAKGETLAFIHDLSPGGMLIETSTDLAVGEVIVVELPQAGAVEARVIRGEGGRFACRFKSRISKAAISAALLKSSFPRVSQLPSIIPPLAPAQSSDWQLQVEEEPAPADWPNALVNAALIIAVLLVLFFLYIQFALPVS